MAKDDVQQAQDVEATEAHAEVAETDWKAQARKWEKRAKENSAAADELAKLKESQTTELERAQARASKAEKALKTLQEKAEHEKLKEQIAQELKVPANLILDSDEEGMRAWAKSLAEFAKPRVGATVPKNSQFAHADTKQDDRVRLAKQVFN